MSLLLLSTSSVITLKLGIGIVGTWLAKLLSLLVVTVTVAVAVSVAIVVGRAMPALVLSSSSSSLF